MASAAQSCLLLPTPLTGTHLLLHWPVFILHPKVPAPPGGVVGPSVCYKHEGEGRAAGRLERPCVRQPAGGWLEAPFGRQPALTLG